MKMLTTPEILNQAELQLLVHETEMTLAAAQEGCGDCMRTAGEEEGLAHRKGVYGPLLPSN